MRWRWPFPRPATAVALGTGGLVLVLSAAASVYLAYRIDVGALAPDPDPPDRPLEVLAMDGDQISLRGDQDDLYRDGLWGLEWDGGYGQVGDIVSADRDTETVVRTYTTVDGTPAIGTRVRLDSFAFPATPASRGLPFEEVMYAAPGGPTPAWRLPGSSDTWAVFVHGKGAHRGEALRMLPTVSSLGMPALAIEYRNDRDAPGGQSGRFAYGTTEWEDLQAAVQYAVDAGASRVVLVGYSMGGGIVMSFMQRSELASRVAGLILDAPMLNLAETVSFGLREGGVPGWFTGPARLVAELRYGVDWTATDYLRNVDVLKAPILLFHTTGDNIVPVSTSDRLAAALPDLVTYERTEGPGHVRSWNLHPAEYEASVRAFLIELGVAGVEQADARQSGG